MRLFIPSMVFMLLYSGVFVAQAASFSDGAKAVKKGDYSTALNIYRDMADAGNARAENAMGNLYFKGWGVKQDYAEAMRWYGLAADAGYISSQHTLALMYFNGMGVKKDPAAGLAQLRAAAQAGFAPSQYMLGRLYRNGEYVQADAKQAAVWWDKAAQQDDAQAQVALSGLYAAGLGVAKNDKKANTLLQQAADHGHGGAAAQLAGFYLHGEKGLKVNASLAIKYYRLAASSRDHAASLYATDYLGKMYHQGWGVPVDFNKAFQWTKKAADMGLKSAQGRLGFLYLRGDGVQQDDAQALAWSKKAADDSDGSGDKDAQNNLGVLYADGYSIAKDCDKAITWYRKSAKQGYALAQTNLGKLYLRGDCIAKDEALAFQWLTKAADQHERTAEHLLAHMYAYGLHVKKDLKKSFAFELRSAKRHYRSAQFNLVEDYAIGIGVDRDPEQAHFWYEAAVANKEPQRFSCQELFEQDQQYQALPVCQKDAERGDAQSQYLLGSIYANGNLGEVFDLEKAVLWLERAAEQGHAKAQMELAMLSLSEVENDAKAEKWLLKLSQNGNADAQERLGEFYDFNRRGYEQAIHWYTQAWKNNGSIKAVLHIAHIYETGRGILMEDDPDDLRNGVKKVTHLPARAFPFKNRVKSLEWYLIAAKQGNALAQYKAGALYFERHDYALALAWYQKSAQDDHAPAQNNIAWMYEHGLGVAQNKTKALEWYAKAVKHGLDTAEKNMRRLQKETALEEKQ